MDGTAGSGCVHYDVAFRVPPPGLPPTPDALPTSPLPAVSAAAAPTWSQRARDLKELTKPNITLFVAVMAAAGYLLSVEGAVEPMTLIGLVLGTALTSGGAGALNHLAERPFDARMRRTMKRPMVKGRIGPVATAAWALLLFALGTGALCIWTNGLTAILATLTVVLYVGAYTPMKRLTKHNTLFGAIPGALPALGGCAAATGALTAPGWAVFSILFLWQIPHFFALAWMYREDYAAGGFRMMPVVEPDGRSTARYSLGATLLLLVAGAVPTVLGVTGWLYLFGMLALGVWFTLPAFQFYTEPTDARARRLLLASIAYVPAFFALVALDFVLG